MLWRQSAGPPVVVGVRAQGLPGKQICSEGFIDAVLSN